MPLNVASNVATDPIVEFLADVFAYVGGGRNEYVAADAEESVSGDDQNSSDGQNDKNEPTFDPTADVVGWRNEGERIETYSLATVNSPGFDNEINFNSIEDSVIGNEVDFVSARPDNGNKGKDNHWYDTIESEDGETYIIRLYVHNNAKNGYEDAAEDVRLQFDVPDMSADSIAVHGVIYSSNAKYAWYSDGMKFVSKDGRPFHMEYIKGSTLYENNGIAAEGGIELPDAIVSEGTYIGYNALDGRIPGCYQYASYTTIKVKVAYD